MKSPFRPSSVISQQIDEFKSTIPTELPQQLSGDFAAELQWEAWQLHLSELKQELELAIDHEMAVSDLQISLSGKPVSGHSVSAGFLAGILANAEKLVDALSELGGKVSDSILGSGEQPFGLMIDGAFESSFGVKMRLSTPDFTEDKSSRKVQVADEFCSLLDGSAENSKLHTLLSKPSVRSSYIALIKCLAKSDGKIFVRTRTIRYGVRMSAYQAKQRIEWLANSSKQENLIQVEGTLTGGSIKAGKFEINDGEKVYSGPISTNARKQLTGIKLGQIVRAQIKETKTITGQVESTNVNLAKYYLEEISSIDESRSED